jgi:hypothetical protein
MSQPAPVQGWSGLLLALPEFILTDARIDEHDELVADVVLPRGVQPCTRCGTTEEHPIHDWRTPTVRHLPVAVAQGRDRASAVRLLADHAPDAQVVAWQSVLRVQVGRRHPRERGRGRPRLPPDPVGAAGPRRGPPTPTAAGPRPPRAQGRPLSASAGRTRVACRSWAGARPHVSLCTGTRVGRLPTGPSGPSAFLIR